MLTWLIQHPFHSANIVFGDLFVCAFCSSLRQIFWQMGQQQWLLCLLSWFCCHLSPHAPDAQGERIYTSIHQGSSPLRVLLKCDSSSSCKLNESPSLLGGRLERYMLEGRHELDREALHRFWCFSSFKAPTHRPDVQLPYPTTLRSLLPLVWPVQLNSCIETRRFYVLPAAQQHVHSAFARDAISGWRSCCEL